MNRDRASSMWLALLIAAVWIAYPLVQWVERISEPVPVKVAKRVCV